MSKLDTSPLTSTLYSYTSGENVGVNVYPFIFKLFKSEFTFSSLPDSVVVFSVAVEFEVVSFLLSDWEFPSSLVTFIVYVFCVPSSAVTTTFNVFLPTFNFCVPFPFILAFLSCAVA